jgi:hypothetical protein
VKREARDGSKGRKENGVMEEKRKTESEESGEESK